MSVSTFSFGTLKTGEPVTAYRIENACGDRKSVV